MRKAIIDLGTNTFNLLIVDHQEDNKYQVIHQTKYPAKLGKGGINDGIITDEAFTRGIEALKTHQITIKTHKVESVICIATAAIRSAKNGKAFVDKVKQELNLDIVVVDGQKEAQLIFDGVKQVVPIGEERVMILDIGGGSNEFIICNKDGVIWKHSFNLGMARLLDRFQPTDPISQQEIETIEAYLKPELDLLYKALKKHPTKTLIGSSGSFDTLAAMIAAIHHPFLDMNKIPTYNIPLPFFKEMHQTFITSTHSERVQMNRMDLTRVEMIVVATIFINFIIKEFDINEVWQCSYALKEGTINQIINNTF